MLLSEFEKWFRKKYGISVHDLENTLINAESEESEKNLLEEVENDALAYIQAKKKVHNLI